MSRYTGYFIIVNQALSQKNRFQNRNGGKRQPGSKNLQSCHPERAEISALLRCVASRWHRFSRESDCAGRTEHVVA
jgi:hypothetical protein